MTTMTSARYLLFVGTLTVAAVASTLTHPAVGIVLMICVYAPIIWREAAEVRRGYRLLKNGDR